MADVSAAKPITVEVMRSPAAARVISATAAESPAAAPSASSAKSSAAECERFRSSGERDSEDHNGNAGDRSFAGEIDYYRVHGWWRAPRKPPRI